MSKKYNIFNRGDELFQINIILLNSTQYISITCRFFVGNMCYSTNINNFKKSYSEDQQTFSIRERSVITNLITKS